MTRNVPYGGCSFGFNLHACVCVFMYCAHMHALLGVDTGCLPLSPHFIFWPRVSPWRLKLTASARLAEQQLLGILPFECWNYSQELYGCWESKLWCSCLYSKQFIYWARSPAQLEVLIEDMWRECCSVAPCGLEALIRNNTLSYKPMRILGSFLLQHSLLWSTNPCVRACFGCCRHCVSLQHPLGHH